MFKVVSCLTFIVFSANCSKAGVLREHVRDNFLKYHNLERERYDRPAFKWSERLAANAMQNARDLGAICWANDWAQLTSNVYQQWGARVYFPRQVVASWMDELDTKENILFRPFKFIGCGYAPCRDEFSYATAVIYVCHFSV